MNRLAWSGLILSKTQFLPAYVEAVAVPFQDRIPAGTCDAETLWDTRTLEPAQARRSPYCKTLRSGKKNKVVINIVILKFSW